MNLQPPILENDLILLKPLQAQDFERLFVVAADRWIWEQHPANDRYKQDVFQSFFEVAVASKGAFLVFDRLTNTLIGSTRYYDYEPKSSSIAVGYTFLARKFWDGRYNLSMKTLMLDYAFRFANVVIFHVGINNIRSQKAIMKLGAKQKMQKSDTEEEKHPDGLIFEIRKEEWLNKNKKDIP